LYPVERVNNDGSKMGVRVTGTPEFRIRGRKGTVR
jgi:hypothetical protein